MTAANWVAFASALFLTGVGVYAGYKDMRWRP